MERGGAMATGDTGPEATTTARGRLATMVTMERLGAMATGAMATVSITDKS